MGFLQSSNNAVLRTGPCPVFPHLPKAGSVPMAGGPGAGSAPRCSHPHRRTRSLNRNTSCKQSLPPSKIRQLLPSPPPPRNPGRSSPSRRRGLSPPAARISPSATRERGRGGERGRTGGSSPKVKGLWPFGASLRGVCRQEKKNIYRKLQV